MKLKPGAFLSAILLLFLRPVIAAEEGAAARDTVVLKNGRRAECEILSFTDSAVRLRHRASPEASWTERSIPVAEVDYILFAPLPGEAEALSRALEEGRPDVLMPFWVKRQSLLGRPRSNAGELGLAYAEILTRFPSADRLTRAAKVYERIEAEDWNAGRRGRARAGMLRLLLRQGKFEEVPPRVEKLLAEGGGPRVEIELRHVLAEANAARLRKLLEDHPRWEQEDDVVPERDRLLNAALDGYLFPHLFHGAEEDLAARGLKAAADLARENGNVAQAEAWCQDLLKLYPGTPEARALRTAVKAGPAAGSGANESVEP